MVASPPPDRSSGRSSDALHDALLEAHAADDDARLARLYRQAADDSEERADTDAACFFLTQAWVFALQADSPEETSIRDRLTRAGRV